MHKLLSLVLSVSIVVSSLTPALAGGLRPVRGLRNVNKTFTRKVVTGNTNLSQVIARRVAQQAVLPVNALRARILTGNVTGIARQILTQPASLRAGLLRDDFVTLSFIPDAVTPAQRAQAVKAYQTQLKNTKKILSIPSDQRVFLKYAQENPTAADVMAVRNILSDASAVGAVGTKEDAPVLLNFWEQAQGTQFEEIADLITAHGLLRMQAYEALQTVITKGGNSVLGGVKEFIAQHNLPVKATPAADGFAPRTQKTADKEMADFLSQGTFSFNRLHADSSAYAAEGWVNLERFVQEELKQAASNMPAAAPEKTAVAAPRKAAAAKQEEPAVAQAAAEAPAVIAEKETPSKWGNIQKVFKRDKNFDRNTFPVEVMDAQGNVAQVPLTFSIGNSLSSNGYDRIVFREEPGFENKYIIEMHDHGKEPIKMGHFYMALYNNDVGALVRAAQKAGVNLRLKLEHTADVNYETVFKKVYDEKTGEELPLEVSVQLGQSLWAREMSQGFSHWLESVGLSGSYSQHILADAKIFLRANGELGVQLAGSKEVLPLPDEYYVRLPKHQVQNVVALLPQVEEGQSFDIVLSPTSNRVNMVARDASLTNVSLGKTMGSVVYNSLDMAESNAKSLMMGINYVMPGFASLMTPALKKYGEKNLLTLSLGMSVTAGVLATLGGFNGFVEGMTLGPVQKGLFVSALLLMSGASIIKQLVSNMLIRANRGEVVLSANTQKAAQKAVAKVQQARPEGLALIGKRAVEFFTNKSEMSLRDLVLYNKGFVNKNIGTLLFLASPFLIQYGTLGLTGIDLGIDYSASFPLYAGYSAYVMWKVLRSKLRDAYTAKNLLQSQQMLANMLKTGTQALAEKGTDKVVIDDVARSFKDSLDALAFAHIKMNPEQKKKEFYQDAKEHILADLELNLVKKYNMPATQAREMVGKVAASIKMQENNFGNMIKMLKAPGVGSLATAMTLATVHEFVISSSFAGTMKDLISQGELANFLMATSLYVPLIAGRLGGNWISRRISADTMYIFCSALSALGTGIMAVAGTSVPLAVTGAAIASLGVGNFFTQMYDYIMNRYPKQNREISSILALTMGVAGLGAVPAGYITAQTMGAPLDLWYAAGALALSLVLTPKMMGNSSLVKGIKQASSHQWQRIKKAVKKMFNGRDMDMGNLSNPGGFINPTAKQLAAQ